MENPLRLLPTGARATPSNPCREQGKNVGLHMVGQRTSVDTMEGSTEFQVLPQAKKGAFDLSGASLYILGLLPHHIWCGSSTHPDMNPESKLDAKRKPHVLSEQQHYLFKNYLGGQPRVPTGPT